MKGQTILTGDRGPVKPKQKQSVGREGQAVGDPH